MNPTIAALKERLESERNDEMTAYELCTGPVGYRNGHAAATEKILPLLERAIEVIDWTADFVMAENNLQDDIIDIKEKAREFLTNVSEFVADASTLADASGELKKPGHYIINAESFDRIIDDLDKEPSEQVKKAREKFLQLKKDAPDENK